MVVNLSYESKLEARMEEIVLKTLMREPQEFCGLECGLRALSRERHAQMDMGVG